MATWDELDNEKDSEKDKEEDNLALTTLTSSEVESNSYSGSECKEEDEVFYKLSRSDLITFIQDLMGRCKEKAIHLKIVKRQYDLLKEELNYVQNKNEALENDHIAIVKEVSDKRHDEHEMALQEFIINGFNRTKLAA